MALLRNSTVLAPGLIQQLAVHAAASVRASSSSSVDTSSSSGGSSSGGSSSVGSSSSSSVPAKQPAPACSSKSGAGDATGEEWTEVIDETSGQPYYWNQKTGETTDLGEPRPKSRFRDRAWQEAAAAGSGPFQEGWREPPGRDLTYVYSMIGTGIGIAVGWASQYMH